MYIKVENGIPSNYSIKQLKIDNPNVSFPSDLPNELLENFSVYKVKLEDMPVLNDFEQIAEQEDSPVLEDGKWVLKFAVRNKTQAEKDEYESQLSIQARDKRDRLLRDSDWTQILDAPVEKAQWATYRQALRDVPQQAGFPQTITWPEL